MSQMAVGLGHQLCQEPPGNSDMLPELGTNCMHALRPRGREQWHLGGKSVLEENTNGQAQKPLPPSDQKKETHKNISSAERETDHFSTCQCLVTVGTVGLQRV